MKYDVLLHLIGWNGDPDDPQSFGTGIRLSKSVALPLLPCVGMHLQLVDVHQKRKDERQLRAKQEVYLSGVLTIDELRFHVREGCVVTIFLGAEYDIWGEPIERKGYLPLENLNSLVEELEHEDGYDSPPNRAKEMKDSFSVQFTENIYLENASGEQRLVSAWTNIRAPIVPPLGSRILFDAINRDFATTGVAPEALTPYDHERVVARVFHSRVFPNSPHGHISTTLESDLLYEVDVEDFEAEVERVTRALVSKNGFQLCDIEA